MTGVSWGLLVAAGMAAAVDWLAVARGRRRVEWVAKPTVMVLLTAMAVALHPDHEGQRRWFVAAGVLSLAGDVFLMLPRDRFLPGLVSFLLAHLAYIAGFQAGTGWGQLTGGSVAVSAALVVAALAIARRVLSGLDQRDLGALRGPVIAYIAVLVVMGVKAVVSGSPRAAVGGLLFVASDGTLAWNRFVRPLRWGPLAVIVTYHLAQAHLLTSLA
jgi:uncharacterized membrane protein YhhN